jgi:hypothetical protein
MSDITPEVQAGAPAGHPDSAAIDDARDRLRDDTSSEETTPSLPIGTVEAILNAPSDLVEDVIEIPEWDCSVRIRSLTQARTAKIQQNSIDQTGAKPTIDFGALQKGQFLHGVIEPKFNPQEVNVLHQKSGPGFGRVITALDKISGTDPKAVKETLEAFPTSGRDGTDTE